MNAATERIIKAMEAAITECEHQSSAHIGDAEVLEARAATARAAADEMDALAAGYREAIRKICGP